MARVAIRCRIRPLVLPLADGDGVNVDPLAIGIHREYALTFKQRFVLTLSDELMWSRCFITHQNCVDIGNTAAPISRFTGN